MTNKHDNSGLEKRVNLLEENRRLIQNSLEMALNLGDFQEEMNKNCAPEHIFNESERRIKSLIRFEVRAFCFVNQDDSDLALTVCKPSDLKSFIEDEIEFFIEKGFLAWAIRESRGVSILSKNQKRHFFLHVIETSTRIRGMFIGLFPEPLPIVPDTSLQLMSIILRNTANALESLEYSRLIRNQRRLLQIEVDNKTEELLLCEKQLLHAQKSEAIATLAGGIAHEFNNALSGVSINTELLQMDFSENKEISTYIDGIQSSIQKMAKLTKQLLAYARGGRYQPKIISFNNFIRDTLPAVKHTLNHSIYLHIDLSDDTWPIEADITQMEMVLAAILSNSSEAIDGQGHIKISAKNVQIDSKIVQNHPNPISGRYVCLEIKDNGKGMNETTRQRLFEPFYSTKLQGRGLGMAAVHGIVKNHGGWIEVESETGKGTYVMIFLPAVDIVHAKNSNAGIFKPTGAESILLVEDEDVVIEATKKMLNRLGYRTLEARTGEEAIKISRKSDEKFDLVLLDMKLPDMNGKTIFSGIKEARPNVKVTVFSGYSIDGPAQELLNAGADGFIQKPFSLSTLSEKLANVLGS